MITMRKDPNGIWVVTINGRTQTMSEWCVELGLNRDAVRSRMRKGWDLERVFGFEPPPKNKKRKGRIIKTDERVQRGCVYCIDAVNTSKSSACSVRVCPHEECPYHDLDSFGTYDEFMKHTNLRGFADALEKFVTSCE